MRVWLINLLSTILKTTKRLKIIEFKFKMLNALHCKNYYHLTLRYGPYPKVFSDSEAAI